MKLRVLGASGSEVPGHNCPAFLLDDTILLDAGTVPFGLNIRDEQRIRHILLTHVHFDHIKGIPTLLDNLATRKSGGPVTVLSGREVLDDLAKNIFNNRIWPDFTKIPSPAKPLLRYKALSPRRPLPLDGHLVFLEEVSHTVPAYGYVIEDPAGRALAYTGDTGPTRPFWERMAAHDVRALIVEVSFPDRLKKLARRSGHLTPSLLEAEIAKMAKPPQRILLTHIKPQFRAEIAEEARALGRNGLAFLEDGETVAV